MPVVVRERGRDGGGCGSEDVAGSELLIGHEGEPDLALDLLEPIVLGLREARQLRLLVLRSTGDPGILFLQLVRHEDEAQLPLDLLQAVQLSANLSFSTKMSPVAARLVPFDFFS